MTVVPPFRKGYVGAISETSRLSYTASKKTTVIVQLESSVANDRETDPVVLAVNRDHLAIYAKSPAVLLDVVSMRYSTI